MWIMCDCFKYFNFQSKGFILLFFRNILVLGPAQWDLYILTDGALPLPAHLLSRIVSNFQVSLFFVCTGYIKSCYVVQVLLLIWSILIYEPLLIHYICL